MRNRLGRGGYVGGIANRRVFVVLVVLVVLGVLVVVVVVVCVCSAVCEMEEAHIERHD
jgi:hypothetical protein